MFSLIFRSVHQLNATGDFQVLLHHRHSALAFTQWQHDALNRLYVIGEKTT